MEEEAYNGRKIYSLSDVTRSIKTVIAANYKNDFYVKAEISKLNYYPHSGHCYPDLVQKNGRVVEAQMRANIWSADFKRISEYFLEVTKSELTDGLNILFLANLTYHPNYGLSLHIKDIVPEYSLGEMMKEKQRVIDQLIEENLFDKNRLLDIPLLPKRIAVISVSTSKGYVDFMSVLQTYIDNYHISTILFPALLQGEGAIDSITAQLNMIRLYADYFDIVVIVRGGGGDIGLSCYDHYTLARAVAEFPLPIITGIGHSTNLTVTEMVANHAAITPTDTANYITQRFDYYVQQLQYFQAVISDFASRKIILEKQTLTSFARSIQLTSLQHTHQKQFEINNIKENISRISTNLINKNKYQIDLISEKTKLLNPENLLKKGYSITLKNNKIVKSVKELENGDVLETRMTDGRIVSRVEETKTINLKPDGHADAGHDNQKL